MEALLEMAVEMAKGVWPEMPVAEPFVPEDCITIGGDQYEYIWDKPIIPGDVRGPQVFVYYCRDTEDMVTIDEAGRTVDLQSVRYGEVYEELQDYLEEREAVDAFEPWWLRGIV